MKYLFFLGVLCVYSFAANAQSRGGEIVRKSNVQYNTDSPKGEITYRDKNAKIGKTNASLKKKVYKRYTNLTYKNN